MAEVSLTPTQMQQIRAQLKTELKQEAINIADLPEETDLTSLTSLPAIKGGKTVCKVPLSALGNGKWIRLEDKEALEILKAKGLVDANQVYWIPKQNET